MRHRKRPTSLEVLVAKIRGGLKKLGDRIGAIARGALRAPLGRRGERFAERYLRRAGYRLLEHNFRAAGAEIDLIATDGDSIVFVEVKTRLGIVAGRPEESVDVHKQARIRRAAEIYLSRRRAHGAAVRFDVVAITGMGRDRTVELFRDAF